MQRFVMVLCALLLLVPLFIKSRTNQNNSDCAAFKVLSSGRVLVKISGDVLHAGVYEVSANALTVSVINMAVPLQPSNQIKSALTHPLKNGMAVSLNSLPDGTYVVKSGKTRVSELLALGIPLDITTMNEADFYSLPGIGPALAKRIVEYRHNNGGLLRVENLLSIEGIGEKKYHMLRNYFQPAINVK